MDEFYGTVAGYKAYHTARGRDTAIAYTDTEIGAALLIASEWLDGILRPALCGTTKTGAATQVRDMPRIGLIDRYGYAVASDMVPVIVENATYEAALRQLQDSNALFKDYTAPKYKRVAVDGAVSVEYANVSAADLQTQIPVIWRILDPLLGGDYESPLSGRVVRA